MDVTSKPGGRHGDRLSLDGGSGGISFFDIFFAFARFLKSMCIVLIIRTKQRNGVKRKPVFRRIWWHGVLDLEK